jgi:hypothetical protein
VLSFADCPHARAAVALVEQVARDTAVDIDLQMIDVPNRAAAVERRFLGSPTIRVEGLDVEPGSSDRADFALACRVYQSPEGPSGLPRRESLEAALRGAKEER